MHIYNTSTQKAEAGGGKFKTNLGYRKRPWLQKEGGTEKGQQKQRKEAFATWYDITVHCLSLLIIQNNYSIYTAIHTVQGIRVVHKPLMNYLKPTF